MIKWLLNLGLIVVPIAFLPNMDTREPKMAAALMVALALSLVAIYKGKIGQFNNRWPCVLVLYMLISAYLSPKVLINIANIPVLNPWMWEAILTAVIFLLMLAAVANMRLTNRDIKITLNIIVWVGFILSIYGFIQAFGIDQFYVCSDHSPFLRSNRIAATLGSPSVLAPFLGIIIPISIYLKKYLKAIFMAVVVFMTNSQVGYGAMVISLLFLFSTYSRRHLILFGLITILLVSGMAVGSIKSKRIRNFIGDGNRFDIWSQSLKELNTDIGGKSYPITGRSPGSFRFLFHLKHDAATHQAHNDYVEFLYNCGIIGLGLLLLSIFKVFKLNFSFKDIWHNKANRYRMALLSSFLCACLCAGGVFVWQLGATIFYTITILGLLYNKGGLA